MLCPPEDHKLTEWRMLAKLSVTGRPIMRLIWTLRRNAGRRDPARARLLLVLTPLTVWVFFNAPLWRRALRFRSPLFCKVGVDAQPL